MTTTSKEYYTVKEVSNLLDVGIKTVYNWINKDKLILTNKGIKRDNLNTFIKEDNTRFRLFKQNAKRVYLKRIIKAIEQKDETKFNKALVLFNNKCLEAYSNDEV